MQDGFKGGRRITETKFNFEWLDIQHFGLQKKDRKEYQHEYYLTHIKPRRQQKALVKKIMKEIADEQKTITPRNR